MTPGGAFRRAASAGLIVVLRQTRALAGPPTVPLLTFRTALALGAILLLAAAVRLVFLARAPAFVLLSDSADFFQAAYGLSQAGEFPLPLKRAPLYPIFLALPIRAIGPSTEVTVLVQHLLGLGSVVLVYLLGAVAFNRPTGLLAALGAAMNGSLLLMEHSLNAEALFTPLLLSALLIFLLAIRSGRLTLFVCAGLILGLSALTRPVAQTILPLLAAVALFQPRAWRLRLAAVGLVCIGFLLVITPWVLRNRAVYGVTAISGGAGDSLVERVRRHDSGFDFHDRSGAEPNSEDASVRARIYQLGEDPGRGVTRIREVVQAEFQLTDAQADLAMRAAALHVIEQQPGYYLSGTVTLFVKLALGVERTLDEFWLRRANQEYTADRAVVEALINIYHDRHMGGLVVGLFLIGTVSCWASGRRGLLLLPLIVASQLLIYVALDGPVARYRYPMQPLITLIACGGLTFLLGVLASSQPGRWFRRNFAAAPSAN
jgi:4-amino-4-deoxy-L-arabinose transferase-like glycosyltransferase